MLSWDETLISWDESLASRDESLASWDVIPDSWEGGNLLLSGTVAHQLNAYYSYDVIIEQQVFVMVTKLEQ